MFARRLFLILFVIVMMATVANAQWSSKMARRGAGTQAAKTNTASQNAEEDDKNRLEGTWRGTESFDFGAFRLLYTFGAGKNANNGIAIHSDELFFTGAPSCLSAQGVWKRTGERKFIVTDEGFCFDTFAGFAPAGKIKFEAAIKLNDQGSEFSGNLHIEAFDVDGNSVFTSDAVLHGTRMIAEAP